MDDKQRQRMHESVDANFDAQIADTCGTLRIRSVLDPEGVSGEHPFGERVTHALDDFLKRARALGFRTRNLDNYVGYAEIGGRGELVGILAHLDVVPEGDERDWKNPPYAAMIDRGEIYARGSIDDKGPAVAALYAMKALLDSGAQLGRRFRLIVGLDEESGSRCIKHYNQHEEIPSFSFSPDAVFPVVNAEKGIWRIIVSKAVTAEVEPSKAELVLMSGGDRFNVVPDCAVARIRCAAAAAREIIGVCGGFDCEEDDEGVRITSRGISAHAMEPERGENAIQKLLALIVGLDLNESDHGLALALFNLAGSGHSGAGFGIESSDGVSGALTCNLAAIDLRGGRASGTKKISMKLDIRYPVTADYSTIIAAAESAAAQSGAVLTEREHKVPLYIPESHPIIRALLDAYEAVSGDRPRPVSMGGGTYCRFMPNSVSAGPVFPGQPELAHQTNERASLDDLRRMTHIYAEALARFNDMPDSGFDKAR